VRTLIAAVLVLLSTPVAGAANNGAALLNGRDLAKACHVLKRGLAGKREQIKIPNTKDAFLCWGYMQAIQDLVVLTTPIIGSCPPEGTPTLDLLRSFLRYARRDPDVLKANPAVAVLKALQDAYPCNQSTKSPKRSRPGK
jgi:hypothetical protein